MPRAIIPDVLVFLLQTGSALALLDVREHGEYNTAHIPGASSLPRRLIEERTERLVPGKGVQVVVCDDDERRAWPAARTLEAIGYRRVAVLAGGVNGWAADGHPTEWGMNVISKDFGEMVEVRHHVPTISARDLARRQQAGEDLLILDTRTPEEYTRACIPGGQNVPGGELALRIAALRAERPDAAVVINCAGRTRGIIGARVLQRMGMTDVVSLRNGTSGWVLAGQALERGADRVTLPDPTPVARAAAEAYAARVADEDGVRWLSVPDVQALIAAPPGSGLYLIDVRTDGEFTAGHIPGFWHVPGGQAVQRADDVAAVRAGMIVFACDGSIRAAITASWYRQMGFPEVYVLRGGVTAWQAAGLPLETGMAEPEWFGVAAARESVRTVTPAELDTAMRSSNPPCVIFVEPSNMFARGHVPGARWLPRGWLEPWIAGVAPDRALPLVATDMDGRQATLAAATLAGLGYTDVAVLDGGMAAWQRAGFPVEQGLTGVMQPPDDVVPAGPDRGHADMIHYLRWEEALGRKYEETGEVAR